MAGTQQLLSQFDESAGHQRGLDELPFVCGDLFSVGLESNDQRDVVIDAVAAGLDASACSSWPPSGSRPKVVARRSIAWGVSAVSATDGPRSWPATGSSLQRAVTRSGAVRARYSGAEGPAAAVNGRVLPEVEGVPEPGRVRACSCTCSGIRPAPSTASPRTRPPWRASAGHCGSVSRPRNEWRVGVRFCFYPGVR